MEKQEWGHPVFHPMDEITIFAARFQNKPIQLFTGYLDSATILQMYPGTITLKATCSLKRLLYTFWDPALPNIVNFLKHTGWEYLPNSGSFANVHKSPTLKATGGQLEDGSITTLIYKVMHEICSWDDSEILIEALPSNIVSAVVRIYNQVSTANEIAEAEYSSFLQAMIGSSGAGSNGPAGASTSDPSVIKGISAGGNGFSKTWKELNLSSQNQLTEAGTILAVANALSANHDLQVASVYASLGECNLCENPKTFTGNGTVTQNGDQQGYWGAFQGTPTNFPDPHDTALMAFYWFEGGKGFQGGGAIKCYQGGTTSLPLLASTVEGNGNGAAGYSNSGTLIALAQNIVSAYNGGTGQAGQNAKSRNSAVQDVNGQMIIHGNNAQGFNLKSGSMLRLQAMTACANGINGNYPYEYGGGHGSLGVPSSGVSGGNHVGGQGTKGFDCSGSVSAVLGAAGLLTSPETSSYVGPTLAAAGHAVQVSAQEAIANKGGVSIFGNSDHVWMMISGRAFGTTDGQSDPYGASWLPAPTLSYAEGFTCWKLNDTTLNKTIQYSSPIGGGNTEAANKGSTTTAGNAISNQSANAFAINLAVPSSASMAEALLLTGSKSLMNCVSIFPFIKQLMSAGLRSFCSLPNGSFFGFYPDYFGEFWGATKGKEGPDTPYWTVDDIEIIDGNIELSDDALATHVYVVGDTVWPAWAASSSSEEQLANMIASGGVVTIENAFESGFVNFSSKGGNSQLKGKINALNFMKRYGARPYINENANFVSNAYLEAFMAFQTFQLMWARQFQTEFQFTFMPELFPGGRVGFPDHGIQCYIDSVTHEFDYEGGFTTNAQIEAPSILPGSTNTGVSQGMVRGDLLLAETSTPKKKSKGGTKKSRSGTK
jgi:hypothetical protein